MRYTFFFFQFTANRLWRIVALLLHARRETASIKSQTTMQEVGKISIKKKYKDICF
jgi:hypothetical protein